MTRKKPTKAEVKASMRISANKTRDTADEMAKMFGGCDDPLHPYSLFDENGVQRFTSWVDFVEKVARPLVMADGDEEVIQKAMALYRTECPYFICVALLMAFNRVNEVNPYTIPYTVTKERGILERIVAELHDAAQVSGGNNMIRSDYLLEIIGDAVECPDCLHWEKERQETESVCRYTFPLPSWAGEDQMDPCQCDLSEGHEGEHSCEHTRREKEEEQIDKDIIEVTKRVAESDYEDYLDQGLRRRPHDHPE